MLTDRTLSRDLLREAYSLASGENAAVGDVVFLKGADGRGTSVTT